nr:hypothetical protein [uncultured Sphaerochaeta sp.]
MKYLKVVGCIIIICLLFVSCEEPYYASNSLLNSKEKAVLKDLDQRFGKLKTSIGETTFEFNMYPNDKLYIPYDYWLQVRFDLSFFLDVKDSISINTEMNQKVTKELKDHQYNISQAIIQAFPGKKISGGYYISGYLYPYIKEGFFSYEYYSWCNYYGVGEPPSYKWNYNNYLVGDFIWTPNLDDEGLER